MASDPSGVCFQIPVPTVTDPVTDDGSDQGVPQTKTGNGVSLTCHWGYWGCNPRVIAEGNSALRCVSTLCHPPSLDCLGYGNSSKLAWLSNQ